MKTGIKLSTTKVVVGQFIGCKVSSVDYTLFEGKRYSLQFKYCPLTKHTKLDFIHVGSMILPTVNLATCPVVDEIDGNPVYLCIVSFIPTVNLIKPSISIGRALDSKDTPYTAVGIMGDFQLEYDYATPYNPNAMDNITNKMLIETKINQLSNMIQLQAKKTDLDHLGRVISTALAQIDMQAGKIELKVAMDSIVSAINMSPEQIQIDTNKLNLRGDLDLTGTFKCYRKTGDHTTDYLYTYGATCKGYLAGYGTPTFSSGVWNPDGGDAYMGYVSVGLTNSDASDANGCLWMSPMYGGGARLHFTRKVGSTLQVAGLKFPLSGVIQYLSYLDNKQAEGIASHVFDGGISTYTVHCDHIACDGNIAVNRTIYTNSDTLFLNAGGKDSNYYLGLNQNGYFLPYGNVELGDSGQRFYSIHLINAPDVSSDKRVKENISYLDTNKLSIDGNITPYDMYKFIQLDLKLATYDIIDTPKGNPQIGFIAQDIVDTKVGKYVVNSDSKGNLSYNMGNRVSVLEGALQQAIQEIENLKQKEGLTYLQ